MTQAEKDRVLSLRQQHHSFSEIAQATGLSLGTVKSFLSRGSRKEEGPAAETHSTITGPRCRQCGVVLEQAGHRRERSFCSDQCRSAYWNSHRDLSRRASAHRQTCEVCGRTFYDLKWLEPDLRYFRAFPDCFNPEGREVTASVFQFPEDPDEAWYVFRLDDLQRFLAGHIPEIGIVILPAEGSPLIKGEGIICSAPRGCKIADLPVS